MRFSQLLSAKSGLLLSTLALINCGGGGSAEQPATAPIQFAQAVVSASPGGQISPALSQQAARGQTLSFVLTPETGFIVSSAQGCGGSLVADRFTTAALTDNCEIKVQFNGRPVAHAGPEQKVQAGTTVRLDASASRDSEQDLLQFQWRLTAAPLGSKAVLSNPQAVQPEFIADLPGEYRAMVQVSDPWQQSTAEVRIIAGVKNMAPIAVAGPDQTVVVGKQVNVSALGSTDPNGDALQYRWSIVQRPLQSLVELTQANTAAAHFTPDLAGVYQLQLIVSDQELSSAPVLLKITVTEANIAPVARAGNDQQVLVGQQVQLSGAASSDANNDSLQYQWRLVSKPALSQVALSNDQQQQAHFTPDQAGSYLIQLEVSDGQARSTDQVAVEAVVQELQFFEKDLFEGWRRIPLPFNSSGTQSASIIGSNRITLGEFRLTALGQSYVIQDVQAIDQNGWVVPTFIGLTEGMTIPAGSTVNFSLTSPLTAGRQAQLRFSFSVRGQGTQFTLQRTLTTN